MKKIGICCIVFICHMASTSAQNTLHVLYQKGGGDYLPLFNGIMEPGYLYGYKNTPYYPQEYTRGSVTYKGWEYKDVEMQIDTYRQCLLVLSNDRTRRIEVPQEYVQHLEIGGMEYV